MINDTLRENQTIPGPPLKTNVAAIAQLAPIASIIVIINTLVFVVFLKTKKLRTPANFVLFSLAIADFMTGALNIPLLIIGFFTPLITSSTVRFYLGYLLPVVHTVTAILSVYHIVIATLEKYLSIIWPITHRLVKKQTVIKVLLMVWLFSFVIGFIPFAWINKIHDPAGTKYLIAYVICCFVLVFFVPYGIMVYAFIKIFEAITRGAGQSGTKETKTGHKKKLARERKCAILFVTMATTFVICWFPWYLLTLLTTLDFDLKALELPAHVITLVRYVTSFINPLLYSLLRPDFRRAVKNLVKRMRLPRTLTYRVSYRRKEKKQMNHDCRVDQVSSSTSAQPLVLLNNPEELTRNEDPCTAETQLCE